MSADSLHFAGVVPITVPTIAFGGATLLKAVYRREPGYPDNPARQSLWRAGNARAGVAPGEKPGRHERLGPRVLDGRSEKKFLATAERAGAYLSPARGAAFDEEHLRWCELASGALPQRTGQG